MSWKLFKPLATRRTKPRKRPARPFRYRPELECLEDRTLLSYAFTFNGSAGDDVITLGNHPRNSSLARIDLNGQTRWSGRCFTQARRHADGNTWPGHPRRTSRRGPRHLLRPGHDDHTILHA